MKETIKEKLKKTAAAISKADMPTSSNEVLPGSDLAGDPTCEICGGLGYVRRDLPVGHPDFGKLEICRCRLEQLNRKRRERLYALSHLDQLSI